MLTHLGLLPAPSHTARVAREAEAAGLDGFWTGDHLVTTDPVLDSAVALAAAAGATTRIELGWAVLLPALRPLAWSWKSVASVQAVSDGRLQLGVGVGGRVGGSGAPDEWRASEQSARGRARRLDTFLAHLPDALAGRPVPAGDTEVRFLPPVTPPPLWVGGLSDAALARALDHDAGWLASMLTPTQLRTRVDALRERAEDRGLAAPRVGSIVFATPGRSTSVAADHLVRMYGLDRETADAVPVGGGVDELRDGLAGFVAAGADTLIVVPISDPSHPGDPGETVELLARARP